MKPNLIAGSWEWEILPGHPAPGRHDHVVLRLTTACVVPDEPGRHRTLTIGLTAAEARELARRLVAVGGADGSAGRGEVPGWANRSASELSRPPPRSPGAPFTAKQGRYLAFIHHYMAKFGGAPAESDIQRHFLVSAPTVNQMMQRLERSGLIARTPGQARSIRLLVPAEWLSPSS
jgi:repressor LexA